MSSRGKLAFLISLTYWYSYLCIMSDFFSEIIIRQSIIRLYFEMCFSQTLYGYFTYTFDQSIVSSKVGIFYVVLLKK